MYKKNSNYGKRNMSNGRYSKYGKFGNKKSFKKTFIQRNKLNAITKYATHKNINPKVKTLDLDFGAYAIPFVQDQLANGGIPIYTTPVIQAINTIQAGAGESQRIGNKLCLKSLRVRLQCTPTGNTNSNLTASRFMIVYDRQTNGNYPAVNNVLSSLNQSATTIAGTFLDNINPNYMERFVVFADEYITHQPVSNTAQGETGDTTEKPFYVDRFIKLKNMETQYNGSNPPLSVGFITTGALFVIAWGTAAGGSDPWFWSGNMRLRFHDC